MSHYTELTEQEAVDLNGGLLAGALVGGILGGAAGLVVATAKGVATGSLSGNEVWKCYTAGAISGAAIGAYTPV